MIEILMNEQHPSNMTLTLEKVHAIRAAFFDRLEKEWSRPPERIDSIMGQAQYYIAPEEIQPIHNGFQEGQAYSSGGERVFDIEHGLLLRSFLVETTTSKPSVRLSQATPEEKLEHLKSLHPSSTSSSPINPSKGESENRTLRFFYSILQAGDWLRFGILIRGDQRAHDLLNPRRQMDLERVWDRPADVVSRGPDGLLIEWRFVEPDFYNNYAIQERFTQIARHLHFRLGWAIHRHFDGFDEEDSRVFQDIDGIDGMDGVRVGVLYSNADH